MSFNSRGGINPVSVGLLIAVAMLGARFACAEDWPRWGGRNDRNMVSREPHLASSFVPGQKKTDGSGIDWATTKNVKWVTRLGSETYSTPVVAAGRVFIGTNDRNIGDPKYHSTEGGLLLCLDAETGRCYWVHDTKAEIWGSTLVADGKVYVGTRKSFVVLAAGKTKAVLGQMRLGTPVWASPVAANGVLFVASFNYL